MAATGRLTREMARRIDRYAQDRFGMHPLVLMENAGRGCADLLERLGIDGLVVICCGKGNNGGDGFVMARHLDLRGHRVRVLYWDDPRVFAPDCLVNFQIADRGGIPHSRAAGVPSSWTDLVPEVSWCVDGLLGTGSRGDPRSPYDKVITWMNDLPCRRFAIDIPSGLDCDTGQPGTPTFRADHTGTMVAAKTGFANPAAQAYLGTIHVVDIGTPSTLTDEILSAPLGAST